MSFSIKPVNTYVVEDPRTRIDTQRSYIIEKSGGQVSVVPQVTTNYSDSQIVFSIVPPSNKVIIDRKVRLQVPVQISFTGNNAPNNLLQLSQNTDAFRAFPLSSIITNIALTLNNTQFSYPMSDSAPALLRYHTSQNDIDTWYSMTPCMPDMSQNYSDLAGSSMNPLNSYQDSQPYNNSRGGFNNLITVVNNSPTAATITAVLTEDIFLSPLLFGSEEESGFIGITKFDMVLNLGNLQRLWSHDPTTVAYTGVTGHINANPSLLMTFITPLLEQPIPKEILYNFSSVVNYQTQTQTVVASNATTTLNASAIQLSIIPKLVYIFARVPNASQTYLTTDTFMRITNANINFNNRTGILASASEQDLYAMCVKNGLKISWPQWTSFVGSVLCFRPSEDWGLSDLEAPGLVGFNANLQVQVTVQNINQTQTITPVLYVVTVSESVLTISDGSAVQQLGILSQSDILNAKELPVMSKTALKNIYGGDFLSSLKAFGQSVLKGIREVVPFVKEVAPVVKSVASLLSDDGGDLVGGRRISRSALRRR